jgi:hypothetical protein
MGETVKQNLSITSNWSSNRAKIKSSGGGECESSAALRVKQEQIQKKTIKLKILSVRFPKSCGGFGKSVREILLWPSKY